MEDLGFLLVVHVREWAFAEKRGAEAGTGGNAVGSNSVYYKGYRIESYPSQHSETDQWRARIFISWAPHDANTTRSFSSNEVYRTHEEANLQGLALGESIIDGKSPGLLRD